jgi:NADH:ubiquinone oxidoreductase, Na(+)-translocating, A subunit
MSTTIRLRKGLSVPLQGEADKVLVKARQAKIIVLKPDDFRGVTPKLLVKEGDTVMAGTPVMADKYRPEIQFTAPVGGSIAAIVRGEKRKLLEIRIASNPDAEKMRFSVAQPDSLSKEEITQILLQSGCWPYLKQRPYGIIPNPTDTPKGIFISGFDSAPLAPDMEFVLKGQEDDLQAGIEVLRRLAPQGGIHLSILAQTPANSPLRKLRHVQFHSFEGPHPAGNVGVQIHHIAPISKGETAWTIDLQSIVVIGRLFRSGCLDSRRMLALTGPGALEPCYIKAYPGTPIAELPRMGTPNSDMRYVSGNCLTGDNVGYEGALGFYHQQITVLQEGNYHEFIGWVLPYRKNKFSVSHSYFNWLIDKVFPKQRYALDTNTNGGLRAFVLPQVYSKVLPMDIYPCHLLKAILAEDIDNMEALGIYEVIEEDFALCEFVCPSKIEIQAIISKGIDLMIKEMS